MIIRKMLLLFFTGIGLAFSLCFSTFILSKKFREFVAVQVLKVTWPEKLGGAFSEDVISVGHGSDAGVNPELFSRMGELLESYCSRRNTAELEPELHRLYEDFKECYEWLKSGNASQKRLRSIAYQMECIQAIMSSNRHRVGTEDVVSS